MSVFGVEFVFYAIYATSIIIVFVKGWKCKNWIVEDYRGNLVWLVVSYLTLDDQGFNEKLTLNRQTRYDRVPKD
jgi:hypothetical protein